MQQITKRRQWQQSNKVNKQTCATNENWKLWVHWITSRLALRRHVDDEIS